MDDTPSRLTAYDEAEMVKTWDKSQWQDLVEPYRHAHTPTAIFQLVSTLILIVAAEGLALRMLSVQPWLTVVFDLIAAGFLVRVFIFQHDCGHGSFLPRQKWNDVVGVACGFLSMTPYFAWARDHAIHHATTGDLDRRGTGDVMTATVTEYQAMSPLQRFGYRVFRNPFFMFVLGAFFLFLVLQRFPGQFLKHYGLDQRERRNVHLTTFASLALLATLGFVFGWQLVFLVHLPAAVAAGGAGIFLFYCQHQYEGAYWHRHKDWSFAAASIEGSSNLKMPRVLQYFSGSIGIHHIHHLAPKVPNYKLQQCLDANEYFQKNAVTLSVWDALRAVGLKLYDEDSRRMITWSELRALRERALGAGATAAVELGEGPRA